MDLFAYMAANASEISVRVAQHAHITLLSVVIAVLVGMPLGILISYIKPLKKPVLGFSNVVQAVPSIALLGFLVPFLGIGEKPAIFMVVVYSLLPIVKNTSTGLSNINQETSDLAKVSSGLVFGGTFEVLNRNDGIPNLKKVYNMSFKNETAIDGTLRYTAIENDEIQVTDAFSTDGMLLRYKLVVLEDDKNFFPPYHAAPIIRAATAKKYPELVPLLNKLAGVIDDETMRGLNYKVDVSKESPQKVAEEFLKSKGLIQ